MNIHFKKEKITETESFLSLYEQVGWIAYLGDNERIKRAFQHSEAFTARNNDGELLGFIRYITDFSTIAFIQDIVVNPTFWRQKIGTNLMKKVLEPVCNLQFRSILAKFARFFVKNPRFSPTKSAFFSSKRTNLSQNSLESEIANRFLEEIKSYGKLQIELLTDSTEKTKKFYHSCGFVSNEQIETTCFILDTRWGK